MIIAVDFDGTIVEHKYPAIGKEKIFAFETLKSLQDKGHLLILWTIRTGKELDDAVEYCRKKGLEFYAINRTHPEEEMHNNISRKVNVDLFIDDRNVGGFMGWGEIWQWINREVPSAEKEDFQKQYLKAKKRTICGFLQAIFCK